MALTTSSYARAVCSVSTTSIVRRYTVTGTIRSGMVLMAGIRRIARHGIGAGTATIRGIARGTTRGIIRGTIHGTTTAGVGTILIGAGACHTFTTLIAADQTRHATSLRVVSAAAHDSAIATRLHATSAIHTDSATRHATTRASTTTAIRTSSSTVVPTMLSRNIATTASAAIVVASAEAASVEAIAAVVASAVVAVAVSAAEDNKGGSPSITI